MGVDDEVILACDRPPKKPQSQGAAQAGQGPRVEVQDPCGGDVSGTQEVADNERLSDPAPRTSINPIADRIVREAGPECFVSRDDPVASGSECS